jgi:hypothetical protein
MIEGFNTKLDAVDVVLLAVVVVSGARSWRLGISTKLVRSVVWEKTAPIIRHITAK